MLILIRKVGQGILIGENIRVSILDICQEHTRLGISAPAGVRIIRNELYIQNRDEDVPESSDDGINQQPLRASNSGRAPILIMTRRLDQSVMIGNNIEVSVIRYGQDNDVSIGIKAPRNITVIREEIQHSSTYKQKNADSARKSIQRDLTGYQRRSLEAQLCQEIDIQPQVTLCVVSIGKDNASLGITAPRRISVHRGELTSENANPHLMAIQSRYESGKMDPEKIGTLIIHRYPGESITIDNDTIVVLKEITPQKIKIEICTNHKKPGYGPKPRNHLGKVANFAAKKDSGTSTS